MNVAHWAPQVVTHDVLRPFFERFVLFRGPVRSLHIVSPWITNWRSGDVTLALVLQRIRERRIPTFVVTRPPELRREWDVLERLVRVPNIEVVFCRNLHAKYYVCESIPAGFALVSSANLTAGSNDNWEIGVIFDGRGGRDATIHSLMDVTHSLRSLPESQVHSESRREL